MACVSLYDLFIQLNPCVKKDSKTVGHNIQTSINVKSVKVKTGREQLKVRKQRCSPPVGERLRAAHGVGDDSGMLD